MRDRHGPTASRLAMTNENKRGGEAPCGRDSGKIRCWKEYDRPSRDGKGRGRKLSAEISSTSKGVLTFGGRQYYSTGHTIRASGGWG